MFSSVISAIALVVSITVAYLTLFRRGQLGMTQPALIGFLHEGEQPKVFFRAMLYATGKRGHLIEALYLKVRRGESAQTFSFWMYGETKELKIGSGLRVGEDGASFNHHFLPPKGSTFAFLAGEYVIDVYARVVNRAAHVFLSTVVVTLSPQLAGALKDQTKGVLYTWGPDSSCYLPHIETPPAVPMSDFEKFLIYDSSKC